ncbi:nucleoside-diphosphate kinase [Streptomyces sp. RKCA744]|uniref:nucleoside-diphosphate kinase n=1 Tax=Streptomyces sp. RKCA744 TaxID=2959340 RepID=UPI0020A1F645|nr:nucleoside-diphosphate kinase [Streptomyces sp. RKCA744]MCO8304683.1 hypothetical protein [Streptomyces sp. RKCA744]
MASADNACRVPPELSRVPRKREVYAGDPYFRDAWDDLRAAFGDGPDAVARLHRAASLVLRPDAVATRGGERLLRAVCGAGFVPVACEVFRFDRHTTREVWRYQLNIATRERIDVMDMIMPAGDALYVLLREDRAPSAVPAATRLSSMKGPSRPEDRGPADLRTIAGPAQASVLTYVHVADEPADVVRDLGIFFDRPERNRLLARLDAADDATDAVLKTLAEVEARSESSALTWRPALDRLEVLLADRTDATGLRTLLHAVRSGRSRDWQTLLALADRLGVAWSHWDRVAVAAELSARHFDAVPILPDVGHPTGLPAEPAPRPDNEQEKV